MKSTSQSTQFFSVEQAASFLSVSASQILLIVANRELEIFTLASAHPRISAKSVKTFANRATAYYSTVLAGEELVSYCRTSSLSQTESLTRQTSLLSATISERENLPPTAISMLSECCSSFRERKVFNQFVLYIVRGRSKRFTLNIVTLFPLL